MADRDRSRGHAGLEGVGGGSAMPLALGGGRAARLVAPGGAAKASFRYARNPAVRAGRSWRDFTSATTLAGGSAIRPAAAPACGRAHGPPRPIPSGPRCPGRPAPIAAPPRRVAGKHRRDTHTDRRAAAFLEAPQGHVLVVLAQCDAIMLAQVLRRPARRDAPDKRARRRGCGGSAPADRPPAWSRATRRCAPLRPSRRWTAAADRRTASGWP